MKRLISLFIITIILLCTSCSLLHTGQEVQVVPNGPFYDSHTVDITYRMDSGSGSDYDVKFGKSICAALFVNWTAEQKRAANNWYSTDLFDTQGMPTNEAGEISVSDKVLLIYDYTGALISDINLNDLVGDFYDIPRICVDTNDNVHVLITEVDYDSIEYTYNHLTFDSRGNLISNIYLSVDEYLDIQQIIVADDELVVLGRNSQFEECIIYFAGDGSCARKENDFRGFVYSLYYINDTVYAKASFTISTNFNITGMISLENFLNNNFEEYIDLSEVSDSIFESNGGIVYLYNDEILYLDVDTCETTAVAVISGLDLGIYCTYIHMNLAGEIVVVGTSGLDLNYGMSVIVSCDEDVNANKQIIYAAGIGINNDPVIEYMKFQYNNTHTDSRIELVDYYDVYGNSYSEDELYEKITNDLLFGNLQGVTPDILIDKDGKFPIYSISNENYLYDLSDRFYSAISEEDYDTNVFSYSQLDGQLFSVFLGYTLNGLMIFADHLNEASNWNIETFEDIADNSDIQMIPNLSAEELLLYQLNGTYEDYFDVSSKTVNFDSDDFRLLLSWAREFSDEIFDSVTPPFQYFIQDEMHYSESVELINIQSLFIRSEAVERPVSVVGFPAIDDTSLIAVPEYRFAILSGSDFCDESWEFIMAGFDNVAQHALARLVFPVSYSGLNYGIEYTSDNYLPVNTVNDRAVLMDNVNEMLSRVNCVSQYDPEVFGIIREEAGAYFAGDKSVDEVCELIQNRCEIIMSERYE